MLDFCFQCLSKLDFGIRSFSLVDFGFQGLSQAPKLDFGFPFAALIGMFSVSGFILQWIFGFSGCGDPSHRAAIIPLSS